MRALRELTRFTCYQLSLFVGRRAVGSAASAAPCGTLVSARTYSLMEAFQPQLPPPPLTNTRESFAHIVLLALC